MSIDVSGIDLSTPEGQNQAIMRLMGEHNDQEDRQIDSGQLPIVAFGVAQITVTAADRTNSNPLVVFKHNLGYAPIFQLFQGTMAAGGITGIPGIDPAYLSDFIFVGHLEGFADATNLYVIWNDQLQSGLQSVTYTVFGVPIQAN